MQLSEVAKQAAVLKALAKGWDLVDNDPDIDFLVLVNEDREELDFYPQKSFIHLMERSGLIENLDNEVPEPHTFFKRDPTKREWEGITVAGPIVLRYRVTPKGQRFL